MVVGGLMFSVLSVMADITPSTQGIPPVIPYQGVLELNGQPVSGIPAFLDLVRNIEHGANVRVKTCDLNGKHSAYTLKTDHNYWRSYEVYRKQDDWVLHVIPEPVQ